MISPKKCIGIPVIDMTGCMGDSKFSIGMFFIEKAGEEGYFENPEKGICMMKHKGVQAWIMTTKEFKTLMDINARREFLINEEALLDGQFVCALDIPDAYTDGKGGIFKITR